MTVPTQLGPFDHLAVCIRAKNCCAYCGTSQLLNRSEFVLDQLGPGEDAQTLVLACANDPHKDVARARAQTTGRLNYDMARFLLEDDDEEDGDDLADPTP